MFDHTWCSGCSSVLSLRITTALGKVPLSGFAQSMLCPIVLECTSSVQRTGVDPTFRTAYMHPEKWHKAWFGLFQLQGVRSYFKNVSGVVETCGCGRSGLRSD